MRKKTSAARTFKPYFSRVLHQIHPSTSISSIAKQILDDSANDLLLKIASLASELTLLAHHRTLSSLDIKCSVAMILTGELVKHAIREGLKAQSNFLSAPTQVARKRNTASMRAGLIFPVTRVLDILKSGMFACRVSKTAAVYLAAVLEYIASEVLELAGNVAIDNKKARVTPRHIMLAVKNDSELSQLFGKVTMASSGTMPQIYAIVLPKKKKVEEPFSNTESAPMRHKPFKTAVFDPR